MSVGDRKARLVLGSVTWGYLVWSLFPVLYALRASVNATGETPPEGFSLDPFRFALGGGETTAAFVQSMKLALITVAVAVPLGTSLAIALRHLAGRGWRILGAGLLASVAIPPVATAMVLFYLFAFVFRIGLSTQAQLIGHISYALPFVALVVWARLWFLDRSFEEQAVDLGAPPLDIVRRVLLPLLAPAIVVAATVAFTLSFNQIVISRYLCFPNECRTIPVLLFGGRSQDDPPPGAFALAVLATAVSLLTLAAGILAVRAARRRAGSA